MFKLAKRANIPVSQIRQVFQQIPSIKKQREDEGKSPLIDLSIGQPHLPANSEVMQELKEMKFNPLSLGYTAAQGESETLAAIVKLYKKYYPLIEYSIEETMVTIGGSGALSNIFSILVEKEEDIILTFEPFFAAYLGQIQEWGGSLKKIATIDNQFRPTAEALEQAMRLYPKAKAIILNYPNNPSGVSLTKAEVISLAQVLEKHPDILIIIDDVYRDFNFKDHFTILDVAPHLKNRCLVINSGAKGLLGAPGERIGMLAGHKELIKRMLPRQTNGLSSVPYRTQAALRCAIKFYLDNTENNWLITARKEYKKNVDTALVEFKKQGFSIGSVPDGAFYLLVSARNILGKKPKNFDNEIKTDIDIANYFLISAGVAVVPGSGFGIDPSAGYLRISCAKENYLIIEAAKRMGDAVRLLLAKEEKLIVSESIFNNRKFLDIQPEPIEKMGQLISRL